MKLYGNLSKRKTAEIEDVQNEEVEENWTENDKKELIEEYTEENNCYKTMIERIKSGYVPGLEFETDYIGVAIYLVVKDIIILNMKNKKIRLSNMTVEFFIIGRLSKGTISTEIC